MGLDIDKQQYLKQYPLTDSQFEQPQNLFDQRLTTFPQRLLQLIRFIQIERQAETQTRQFIILLFPQLDERINRMRELDQRIPPIRRIPTPRLLNRPRRLDFNRRISFDQQQNRQISNRFQQNRQIHNLPTQNIQSSFFNNHQIISSESSLSVQIPSRNNRNQRIRNNNNRFQNNSFYATNDPNATNSIIRQQELINTETIKMKKKQNYSCWTSFKNIFKRLYRAIF